MRAVSDDRMAKPDLKGASLIEEVVRRLGERGETLGLAESCTGGLLSARIAALPGVSSVFLGSIVVYSNSAKVKFLDVSMPLLKTMGAVSVPVAQQMAVGARTAFSSTWALSITGIAGPGGGSERKPVGTVCFGLAGPGLAEAEMAFFSGDRIEIQSASAEYALGLLLSRFCAESN